MKYAFTLRFIFEFQLISFHKTFISSHSPEDMKKKLKEQLYRFRVVKSKKRSAMQHEKFTVSLFLFCFLSLNPLPLSDQWKSQLQQRDSPRYERRPCDVPLIESLHLGNIFSYRLSQKH